MKYTVEIRTSYEDSILNPETESISYFYEEYWFKYKTDILHREGNLPAEITRWNICYYLNGKLHRTDGPAHTSLWNYRKSSEIIKRYYLNGTRIFSDSDEEFLKIAKLQAFS